MDLVRLQRNPENLVNHVKLIVCFKLSMRKIYLPLLLLCASLCANAQADKSQPITVPKFEKPPTIDGKLDEEVWQKAAVLKDFYQIQPGDNTPPSKPTEVLIGFDPQFLYI